MTRSRARGVRSAWRRAAPIAWQLAQPHRAAFAAGFVLMVGSRVAAIVPALVTRRVIDNVMIGRRVDQLAPLAAIVVVAGAVQAASYWGHSVLLGRAAFQMIATLRVRLQVHLLRLPIRTLDRYTSGVLVSRVMSDCEGLRTLSGAVIEALGSACAALIATIVLIRIDARIAAMALALILGFGAIARVSLRRLRALFLERASVTASMSGRLTEVLRSIRMVKVYGTEPAEARSFADVAERLSQLSVLATVRTTRLGAGSQLLVACVLALVFVVGTHDVLQGRLTVGALVTFLTIVAMLITPLTQLVASGAPVVEAMVTLARADEILREPSEHTPSRRTEQARVRRGEVVFEGVSFAYDGAEPVLRDVSFRAPAGSITAIVGRSGSGKSTLIGLVAGFYDPTAGRVLVDGTDLAAVTLDSYRRQLGVVLQETFLLDGTILDNVRYSCPTVSTAEAIRACRLARVDEFAERFPKGYDTIIGEQGIRLSGGQRQRVAIARAVLANPAILILDEATSSLDSVSEVLVQQGLAQLMKGRTTFVIAHRLSTVRRADQILVIEDGRVVEQGTAEELSALGGRYAELYATQNNLDALLAAPADPEPEPRVNVAVADVTVPGFS